MQSPSPVGVNVPSVVVPPLESWTSDTRIRKSAPSAVVLTGALQSLGIPIAVSFPPKNDFYLRYRLFIAGAGGAVTGVNFQLVTPSGTAVSISWGPSTALNVLRMDSVVSALSPTYLAFDISATNAGLEIDAAVFGINNTGIIDLQMKNAGAGVYTVNAGSFVEVVMGG